MRVIDRIIIHCSDTPEGRYVNAAEIRRWHIQERGWSDIGYHFVILLDGTIERGRPIDRIGAHCKGQNLHSIGICYVGGMTYDGKKSKDTRTPEQKTAMRQLVQELSRSHGPLTVHGHNEFSEKDCPCFNVRAEFYPIKKEAPHSLAAQGVLDL